MRHATGPAYDAGDAAPAAGYGPLPAREERDAADHADAMAAHAATFLRQLGWTPPAEVDRLQDELDEAHAQGWRDAIAALVDDEVYMDWWESSGAYPDEPARSHLACYLEAVCPDGPAPEGVAGAVPKIPGVARAYTITYDGDTHWLECDHCSGLVASVEAGDSLESVATRARDHERVCATARASARGAEVNG